MLEATEYDILIMNLCKSFRMDFFFNNVGWRDTAQTHMISEIHPMELHYTTAHYRHTKAIQSPGFSHIL